MTNARIPIYRIRDWDKHFEIGQSRAELKKNPQSRMRWVAIPNKHDGKSYRRLMRHPQAPALFAAWVLIVQVASKCEVRGTLTSDEIPITAQDLEDKTDLPAEYFELAFQEITSDRIGWMEVCGYADIESKNEDPSPRAFGDSLRAKGDSLVLHDIQDIHNTQDIDLTPLPPQVGENPDSQTGPAPQPAVTERDSSHTSTAKQEGAAAEAPAAGATDSPGDTSKNLPAPQPSKRKRKPTRQVSVEELMFPPELDSPEVRESMAEWLAYKLRRGQVYDGPNALNYLMRRFARAGPPEAARKGLCDEINRALVGQWKGIQDDWVKDQERRGNGSKHNDRGRFNKPGAGTF